MKLVSFMLLALGSLLYRETTSPALALIFVNDILKS